MAASDDQSKVARQVSSRNSDVSSTNTDTERQQTKKIPPIKAPVGLAKAPDLKNCKSKIGSMNNIKHTPKGGGVTIQTQKLNWNARSKIGSLDNVEHQPGGGKLKVESRKLDWATESRVQSLANINHKPGGGKVRIFDEKYFNKMSVKPANNAINKSSEDTNTKDTSISTSPDLKSLTRGTTRSLTQKLRDLSIS